MASLIKTASTDPALPPSARQEDLDNFDKPARARRPRLSGAAAQAEIEQLLVYDPDPVTHTLSRHVDRFHTYSSFLL